MPGSEPEDASRTPIPTDSTLEALYEEYADLVWRALARYGVPMTLVDDAVQDVFLVARRKLEGYEERGQRAAWLLSISRRVASDLRRAETRRGAREATAADWRSAPVDPERALAVQDAVGFVQRFLDQLRPDQREVFVLCDVEGLSAPEVSRALGVELNTVYSRLRRARKKLAAAVARRDRNEAAP